MTYCTEKLRLLARRLKFIGDARDENTENIQQIVHERRRGWLE
jgi:hypothetical protein